MGLARMLFIYLQPLPKHPFILMTLLATEPREGHQHRPSCDTVPSTCRAAVPTPPLCVGTWGRKTNCTSPAFPSLVTDCSITTVPMRLNPSHCHNKEEGKETGGRAGKEREVRPGGGGYEWLQGRGGTQVGAASALRPSSSMHMSHPEKA